MFKMLFSSIALISASEMENYNGISSNPSIDEQRLNYGTNCTINDMFHDIITDFLIEDINRDYTGAEHDISTREYVFKPSRKPHQHSSNNTESANLESSSVRYKPYDRRNKNDRIRNSSNSFTMNLRPREKLNENDDSNSFTMNLRPREELNEINFQIPESNLTTDTCLTDLDNSYTKELEEYLLGADQPNNSINNLDFDLNNGQDGIIDGLIDYLNNFENGTAIESNINDTNIDLNINDTVIDSNRNNFQVKELLSLIKLQRENIDAESSSSSSSDSSNTEIPNTANNQWENDDFCLNDSTNYDIRKY